MADEAVLRIVLQDGGGQPAANQPTSGPASPPPSQPSPGPASPPPSQPQGPAQKGLIDSVIQFGRSNRGLIGGVLGPLPGFALDVVSSLHGLNKAAGTAAGALGPIGIVAAGVAAGMLALDRAVKPLIETYGQYNVQLAQASAQADVRTTLADVRRADQIGPNISRYVDARSRLENSFQDVVTRLLDAVLPIAENILNFMALIFDILKAGLALIQPLVDIFSIPNKILGDIYREIAKFTAGEDNNTTFNPLTAFDPIPNQIV